MSCRVCAQSSVIRNSETHGLRCTVSVQDLVELGHSGLGMCQAMRWCGVLTCLQHGVKGRVVYLDEPAWVLQRTPPPKYLWKCMHLVAAVRYDVYATYPFGSTRG